MHFRTIYGPELEAIYLWLQHQGSQSTGELSEVLGTLTR